MRPESGLGPGSYGLAGFLHAEAIDTGPTLPTFRGAPTSSFAGSESSYSSTETLARLAVLDMEPETGAVLVTEDRRNQAR